ncbi:MAG TPA: fibronectin type III domain-containing protein [Candidatus Microsaccharimonas sp.]|jgi:hypothetical protein
MQPTVIPTIPTEPQSKRHIIVRIIVVIVLLAIIAGAVFLISQYVHQANIEGDVKNEVVKQNKTLKASAKSGIYSATLPENIKTTDKVTIQATVAKSGQTYCIQGTSKADAKVIYHMDNATDETKPDKGSCSDGATVTQAPGTPGDVSVLSTGTDDMTIGWGSTPFAAAYAIQCATETSFVSGLKAVTATSEQVTISGLSSGTDYYCRVAATNAKGQSTWSLTVMAHVQLNSPRPSGVKTISVSKTSFNYAFDAVNGATSYNLQYTTDIEFSEDVKTISTKTTTGTLTGLQPSSVYYIHIQAITPGFDAATAAYSDEIQGYTY